MAGQDFSRLASDQPGLLQTVEAIVLDSHRRLYEKEGRQWSRPIAYRWIRYEDPLPVQRLAEAVDRLDLMGAAFDGEAVEKACIQAAAAGFSN